MTTINTITGVLVPTHGAPRIVTLDPTDLDAHQAVVGGSLEAVGFAWCDATGYIDEEGKLARPPLPANPLATRLCRGRIHDLDYIAGPMLIVGAPNLHGWNTDCPRVVYERLRLHGADPG